MFTKKWGKLLSIYSIIVLFCCNYLHQLPTPFPFAVAATKWTTFLPLTFKLFCVKTKSNCLSRVLQVIALGAPNWWFCVWNLLHPNNIINPLKFTSDFLRRLKSHFQVVFVGNSFSLNTNIFQASLLQNSRNYSLPGNRCKVHVFDITLCIAYLSLSTSTMISSLMFLNNSFLHLIVPENNTSNRTIC